VLDHFDVDVAVGSNVASCAVDKVSVCEEGVLTVTSIVVLPVPPVLFELIPVVVYRRVVSVGVAEPSAAVALSKVD